ncbi:MAG: cytochrome c [Gemmatimonadota bacterium]|nr:cytochrome c [Gemmatimonadota bacterium]MDH5805362.1 cytochrome c [Gemmatimonadota bacterium]
MSKTKLSVVAVTTAVFICAVFVACGEEDSVRSVPEVPNPPAAEAQPAVLPPTGPIDTELAARGEGLFLTRGCAGCHTIGGGRLTGPDLEGVTSRREFPWFIAMVTNPDSMLRDDPIARELFQEYMTAMLPVGVTAEEAAALYEFLRPED